MALLIINQHQSKHFNFRHALVGFGCIYFSVMTVILVYIDLPRELAPDV